MFDETNAGDDAVSSGNGCREDTVENFGTHEEHALENKVITNGNYLVKPLKFQRGVLRTNCIDCLDRTNVAQYAYGLAALGRQLHVLKLLDVPNIGLDSPLARYLMDFYQGMGDALALQYVGSSAHNKVFSYIHTISANSIATPDIIEILLSSYI